MGRSRISVVKDVVRRFVGEGNLGRLDVFRHPGMKGRWGGPFNGQKFRQRIFFDLLYFFPIEAIVETGTFIGTTTALFGATRLPVYSAEIRPRYFSYSKMRFLFNRDNLHFYLGDSRSFLRDLCDDIAISKEDVFFYIDAHGEGDLPLRKELEIVFSGWTRPIVMVDDFQVPNSDYGFNDYGPEKMLDLSYIDPVVSAHKLAVFFPAANSSAETGAKRGSVVLCRESSGTDIDTKIATLVRHRSDSHDTGG